MLDFTSKINNSIQKLVDKEERIRLILLIEIIIFVSVFTIYNMMQHYTFKTYAFDLGIYMQALYTTAFEGLFLYETPDLYHVSTGSFFGVHFTPLTLALVPIYRVFPSALTLFMIQNVATGLSVWFLYKLSLVKTKNALLSLISSTIYMLNPFVHMALMFPFHIEIFSPLFIFMSLYYFETSQFKKSVLSILLLMLTIDFAIIIAAAVALYIMLKTRSKRIKILYLSLFLFSLAFLGLAIRIISLFGPEPLSFGGLFEILGSSWREILFNALTRPDLLIASIQFNLLPKMATLMLLLLPYISALLHAPLSSLSILTPLLFMLLSTLHTMSVPGWHIHGCFFLPLVVVASIDGLQSYTKISSKSLTQKAYKSSICLTIILFILISPMAFHETLLIPNQMLGGSYSSQPEYSPKVSFLHEIIKYVGNNDSILAQNHIFPHFANRVNAYVWIPQGEIVDYAIADLSQHDYYTRHGDIPFNQQFEKLIDQGYRICASGYNIILIAREVCPVRKWVPLHLVYTYVNITAGSFKLEERLGDKILVYDGGGNSFVYGPYVTLPPGTYTVTYEILLLDNQCEGLVGVFDVTADLGNTVLSRKPVYCHELRGGSFEFIQLNFSIKNVARNVEFRIVETPNLFANKLILKKIELINTASQCVDMYDNYLYSANLIPKGATVYNGIILHEPGNDKSVLWFGPYISLKKGIYVALLNIKIDILDNATDPLIQIDVVANKGTTTIAFFNITRDMIYNSQWNSIPLMFELPEDFNDVEIRGINASEGIIVYLAYIRLTKV
ncbi:MAG: DUF2079 domain-containing protein [Thermosphaera sp.]